ncbi:gamma-glutamylcyclotransferase [Paenibacillus sp. strain BS8-2]
MEKVFVYGTLRCGECNHAWLNNAARIAQTAYVEGIMVDTGYGYPAIRMGEQSSLVSGELYEVSETVLLQLDRLEDYYGPGDRRNEYERIRIKALTDAGVVEAWVYVYTGAQRDEAIIPLGDWKLDRMCKEESLVYFAYGSCMDMERIQHAGYDAQFADVLGRGTLEGFTLGFAYRASDGKGGTDIVESGGCVEGKLYRISPQTLMDYLFVREGVATQKYKPIVVQVVDEDERIVDAVTFVFVNKDVGDVPLL